VRRLRRVLKLFAYRRQRRQISWYGRKTPQAANYGFNQPFMANQTLNAGRPYGQNQANVENPYGYNPGQNQPNLGGQPNIVGSFPQPNT